MIPDTADWTITGGIPANSSRTEMRGLTVSCDPAVVTLYVDPPDAVNPNGQILECSEEPDAAACTFIPGADSAELDICQCMNPVGDELRLFVSKVPPAGLRLDWNPIANAVSYRVARGEIGNYYSHDIDEPAGRGICDTGGANSHIDPDDLTQAGSFYYLAVGLDDCTIEGPWGTATDGTPRGGPATPNACP
jgi:hypothetical protein